MFARITAVLALSALTACGIGQTRLNPLNWFGSDQEERIEQARVEPTRPIVQEVVSLTVDRTPGGAIISAVGRPPTQGFWEAELTRVASDDPSVLLLDFNILPPLTNEPVGTAPSREVLVGVVFTTQDLAGVRTIVVQSQTNRRSVNRN